MKRYNIVSHIMIACVTITWLFGQEPISTTRSSALPFNVSDITKQVARHPETQNANTIMGKRKQHTGEWSRDGEFLIDTNIVYGPTQGAWFPPAIAFDGTNYFVVWFDFHDATTAEIGYYGTRVDQSGNILDTLVYIGYGVGPPAIASDGNNYLVVWATGEYPYYPDDINIEGVRVDQFGNVLDTAVIEISTAPWMQMDPSVAFDSTNYFVVWKDWRNGSPYQIYGARVSQSGDVLDPMGIALSTGMSNKECSDVAFDGTNYLVVWEDWRNDTYDIYGTRVTPDGIVLDPNGIAISTAVDSQKCPCLAFNGVHYLVAWQEYRDRWDIYGARVDTSGQVIDSARIPISTEVDWQINPNLGYDGTNFLIVWEDYRNGLETSDIYGARVDPFGNVLDPIGIEISHAPSYQLNPCVAFDNTNYLVVWLSQQSRSIYGSRVEPSGIVLDTTDILVSISTNLQGMSSAAFDGTNYLVVWSDSRDWVDICGIRVDQTANILDSTATIISTTESDQYVPVVAFAGTNYLVAWQDYRLEQSASDIFATRVDPLGNVLDTNGIPVSIAYGNQRWPSIATDGINYFIVWDDERNDSCRHIYGARVDQSGNVLDSLGIAISNDPHGQVEPAVVFGGTNYFAVWCDNRNLGDIYGARIDQSGNVLDPMGIPILTGYGPLLQPAVAFDGTYYLVVFACDYNIVGIRVDQSGNVIQPYINVGNAPSGQCHPSIVFDGTYYLVAWEDWRNGGLENLDIYGAVIDTMGSVVDSFCITTARRQCQAMLAHGVNDQTLMSYTGWTSTVNDKTYNTMRIWGKFYPFVGIEEDLGNEIIDMKCNLTVYPNPFSKLTNISFGEVPAVQSVELKIYNTTGRLVKSFYHTPDATRNRLSWDGRDDSDNKLPSGVYFLTINVGTHTTTEKLLLIR